MIDIKKLTSKDVGRWVSYTPDYGNIAHGRIKSWNDKYIFVVYKCNNEWDKFQNFTGEATNPQDLVFD